MVSNTRDDSQIIEIEVPESKKYLRLLSLDRWAFRGICLSIGLVATNAIRLFPAYYWLYAGASILAVVSLLLFPPGDSRFGSLWRSGAIALLGGLLLPWWEILQFLPKWLWIAIFLGGIALLWAIGGAAP